LYLFSTQTEHVKKPPKTGKAVGRASAQNSGTSSAVPKGGVISAM
jgi:hypothetical protein